MTSENIERIKSYVEYIVNGYKNIEDRSVIACQIHWYLDEIVEDHTIVYHYDNLLFTDFIITLFHKNNQYKFVVKIPEFQLNNDWIKEGF